jgi:anti-anti-sigma regulatory factor
MPALPQLTYSWDRPAVDVSRVRLAGNLVNENADLLLDAIIEQLSVHPGARELHVDCADVDLCDSRGLSVLLMLRRRTETLGIELHVANRRSRPASPGCGSPRTSPPWSPRRPGSTRSRGTSTRPTSMSPTA